METQGTIERGSCIGGERGYEVYDVPSYDRIERTGHVDSSMDESE